MDLQRRRFSGSERAALYLAADGRCTECGTKLRPGWHADHIAPHSRGGITDVINGQALCPPCNLKKGNRVSTLRTWQENALSALTTWRPTGDHGFLIEATPGAGKTRVAIEAAMRMLNAGRITRIVIAVPTARLEAQWAEAFGEHGITINPKWHGKIGAMATDERGCAATYAEIQHQELSFRKLVADQPTLVILDEVHHCGAQKSWGQSIRNAMEPAVAKLLLSGTPFRSDNEEIPFVRYVDGSGTPDFRYGYREALEDHVVRAVFFPCRGGTTEWSYNGQTRTATFDDDLEGSDANRRLRTAVSASGQWLPTVLREADQQLMELRQSDPTAGGIVFCEESNQARAVVDMLKEVGREPVLVISDEPESSDRIEAFRGSRDPWLVSIRQVSEGVDVPRLRVGVYATPWLTDMFFRQVVGRLVRRRPDEDDPSGFLYIPDDERLRELAQQIREARDHVLNSEADDLLLDRDHDGAADGSDWAPGVFTPITSTSENRGVIVDAMLTLSPEELAAAEQIKRARPETASLPTEIAAQLLRSAGHFAVHPPAPVPIAASASKMSRKDDLRKANNTIAASIKYKRGVEMKAVHGKLNHAVSVTNIRQCSEEQLERRLLLAQQWLQYGAEPGAAQ